LGGGGKFEETSNTAEGGESPIAIASRKRRKGKRKKPSLLLIDKDRKGQVYTFMGGGRGKKETKGASSGQKKRTLPPSLQRVRPRGGLATILLATEKGGED